MRGAGAAHLPRIRPRTPYAPHGERSVARGYIKALRRARRLIYLEDQYLWSPHIARLLADGAARRPRAAPDRGRAAAPRRRRPVRAAPQPGRPHAGDLGRAATPRRTGCTCSTSRTTHGTPVYVHAKVAVIDDVWACVGSDNLNRRSWTHDSELSGAVLDDTRDDARPRRSRRARRRRPGVRPRPAADALREHLDRAPRRRRRSPGPRTTRSAAMETAARPPSTRGTRRQGRAAAAGAAAHAPPRTDAAP